MVFVDYRLCEGCEACADAYPELFEMRDGLAWVVAGAAFDPARHEGVERVCPFGAISIE